MRTLVFDMDGTIADLYGYKNWLECLRTEKSAPYENCEPLVNIEELNKICDLLKSIGYKVIITTWLAKESSKQYKKDVKIAKLKWLEKVGFKFDEIHFLQYGTTKANATRKYGKNQVLIDDNEKVRKGWTLGQTINANEDILTPLKNIYLNSQVSI